MTPDQRHLFAHFSASARATNRRLLCVAVALADSREVAFRSWLIRCPDKAAEVLLALETVLIPQRRV